MKKYILILLFPILLTAQTNDNEKVFEHPMQLYWSLGLGGGVNGMAFKVDLGIWYLGFSTTGNLAILNVPKSEICDWCTLPYDYSYTKTYDIGVIDYDMFIKFPIAQEWFIIGTIGYYEHKSIDVETKTDRVYPTEVIRYENLLDTGIGYGLGLIWNFTTAIVTSLEYKNKHGIIVSFGMYY